MKLFGVATKRLNRSNILSDYDITAFSLIMTSSRENEKLSATYSSIKKPNSSAPSNSSINFLSSILESPFPNSRSNQPATNPVHRRLIRYRRLFCRLRGKLSPFVQD